MSDGDRYDGYQTLPTSDGSFEITNTDCEHTNIIQKDFEEVSLFAHLSILLSFYYIEGYGILKILFCFSVFI